MNLKQAEPTRFFKIGWYYGQEAATGGAGSAASIAGYCDVLHGEDLQLFSRAVVAGIREGDRRREAEASARFHALNPVRRFVEYTTPHGRFKVVREVHPFRDGGEGTQWVYEPADWPEGQDFGGAYGYREGAVLVAQALEDEQLREEAVNGD